MIAEKFELYLKQEATHYRSSINLNNNLRHLLVRNEEEKWRFAERKRMLEELQSAHKMEMITLNEYLEIRTQFRRIGETSSEVIEKIEANLKILLEEHFYEKRIKMDKYSHLFDSHKITDLTDFCTFLQDKISYCSSPIDDDFFNVLLSAEEYMMEVDDFQQKKSGFLKFGTQQEAQDIIEVFKTEFENVEKLYDEKWQKITSTLKVHEERFQNRLNTISILDYGNNLSNTKENYEDSKTNKIQASDIHSNLSQAGTEYTSECSNKVEIDDDEIDNDELSENFENVVKLRNIDSATKILSTKRPNSESQLSERLLSDEEKKKMYKRSISLHSAIKKGQVKAVKKLLEKGVAGNVIVGDQSALHYAVKKNRLDCVKLLISCWADIEDEDEDRRKPLHVAAFYNHSDVATFLLDSGAKIDSVDSNGNTPLHVAACNNSIVTMMILLDYGSNMEQENKCRYTPLYSAVLSGYTQATKVLLQRGALVNGTTEGDITPLHVASQKGHTKCVRLLLEFGANIESADGKKFTPLIWAVSYNCVDVAKTLIDRGANVNATDVRGETCLHIASSKGYTDCAQLLLDNEVNVKLKNNSSRTALHNASSNGRVDIVRLLLKNKADVNATDDKNFTALHLAVQNGQVKCVSLLREGGAKTNIINEDGNTALSLASASGNEEMIAILQKNFLNRSKSVSRILAGLK